MITKRESKKIKNICDSIFHAFPNYVFLGGKYPNTESPQSMLVSAGCWSHLQVIKTIKTKSQVNQINKENVLKILVNKKWINNTNEDRTFQYLKMLVSRDNNSRKLGIELLYRQSFFDTYPKLGNLINELQPDIREYIREWPS